MIFLLIPSIETDVKQESSPCRKILQPTNQLEVLNLSTPWWSELNLVAESLKSTELPLAGILNEGSDEPRRGVIDRKQGITYGRFVASP